MKIKNYLLLILCLITLNYSYSQKVEKMNLSKPDLSGTLAINKNGVALSIVYNPKYSNYGFAYQLDRKSDWIPFSIPQIDNYIGPETVIKCDTTGIFWILTKGNLYKYDFSKFSIIDIPLISGTGLYVDSKNSVWVSRDGYGVTLLKDGVVTQFDNNTLIKNSNYLAFPGPSGVSFYINSISEDKIGNIYLTIGGIGANKYGYIIYYDGKNWDYFLQNTVINGWSNVVGNGILECDGFGNLWYLHQNYLLFKYANNKLIKIDSISWKITTFMKISKADNCLWIASTGDNISDNHTTISKINLNDPNCRFQKILDTTTVPISRLYIDNENNKYFGSFMYNEKEGFSAGVGIKNIYPTKIVTDKNGDEWFCGAGGLFKKKQNDYSIFLGSSGLNNLQKQDGLTSIIASDLNKILWIAIFPHYEINSYDGSKWTKYTYTKDKEIYDIFVDDKNNKWFLTDAGLIKYDNKIFTTYPFNMDLPPMNGSKIYINKNGFLSIQLYNIPYYASSTAYNLTFVGSSYFMEYKPNEISNLISNTKNINIISPLYIFDTVNQYYFVKFNDGKTTIFKYDGTKAFDIQAPYSLSASVSINQELVVVNSKGIVYIATSKGVLRYEGDKFTLISIDQGLYDTDVAKLYCDYLDRIWISTASKNVFLLTDSFGTSLVEEIKDANVGSKLSIYPNPVSSELSIKTTETGMVKYQIFNVEGKIIKEDFVSSSYLKVNVQDLKQGIYYINVNGLTNKFIKD
jgi:hypothetical protein